MKNLNLKTRIHTFLPLFLLAFLAISCGEFGSEATVPDAVEQAFQERFPESSDVDWEQEGNLHEVTFVHENVDHQALFNPEGGWLRTEKRIPSEDLPDKARAYIVDQYSSYELRNVEQWQSLEGVGYEVEIGGAGGAMMLVFNGAGEVMQETVVDDNGGES